MAVGAAKLTKAPSMNAGGRVFEPPGGFLGSLEESGYVQEEWFASGEVDGTPYATVPLPVTGAAWSSGGTTSLTLPKAITGTHTVYLRLTTTPDSSHPYVANLGRIPLGMAREAMISEDCNLGEHPA